MRGLFVFANQSGMLPAMELSFVSTLELIQEIQKRFDTSVLALQKSKSDSEETITVVVNGDRWRTIGVASYAASLIAANTENSVMAPDPEDMIGPDPED